MIMAQSKRKLQAGRLLNSRIPVVLAAAIVAFWIVSHTELMPNDLISVGIVCPVQGRLSCIADFVDGHVREGDVVFLTMVNNDSVPFLENFACHLNQIETDARLFVITESDTVFKIAQNNNMFPVKLETDQGDISSKSLQFGSSGYKQYIFTRTEIVGELLKSNHVVVVTDVDAVWLRDPIPHISRHNADLVGQVDNGRLCGGFLLLNGTREEVVKLWNDVEIEYWHQLSNPSTDIGVTEQGILEDHLRGKYKDLDVVKLPQRSFPNGKSYFEKEWEFEPPVVVHNNYIIGKAAKMKRFISRNLWKTCSSSKKAI
eukprot:jgi/Picsp_1/445/NSC_00443-R1_rhamnogalacturonan ii specific xylosyltransferase